MFNSPHPKAGALWARFKTLAEAERRNLSVVKTWAEAKGFTVNSVEHAAVGRFETFPATLVRADDGVFCFPHQTPSEIRAQGDREAKHANRTHAWQRMEWFHPAYVQNRHVLPLLQRVAAMGDNDAVAELDREITGWYTVPGVASSVRQLFMSSPALESQAANIRECATAYYAGFKSAAIGGLIPVVESGLRTLLGMEQLPEPVPIGEKVHTLLQRAADRAVSRLYFRGMWVPTEYHSREFVSRLDEYVYMLDVFETWLTTCFYGNTDRYAGGSGLNRNYFAHGGDGAWCRPTNFHRLLGVLEMICFVEAMLGRTGSVLFPDPSDESREFLDEILLRVEIQASLPALRAARRAAHGGRPVAPTPSDGGRALRMAILRTAARADLNPVLTAHGWRVVTTVDDEEREALMVEAVREDEVRRVALLFTPASANETYRRYDGAVDAILFRGEPYHLESYAFGIATPVHPLRDAESVVASW